VSYIPPAPKRLDIVEYAIACLRIAFFSVAPWGFLLLIVLSEESEIATRWLRVIAPLVGFFGLCFLSVWFLRYDRRRLDDHRLARPIERSRKSN